VQICSLLLTHFLVQVHNPPWCAVCCLQLIGDPRTGVADDTTTAPFNNDIQVEHVFASDVNGIDWFRYSMAGEQLPYMHMDARLSDHSKNMMYMLRCKDPKR
jgi:hypothetical protein